MRMGKQTEIAVKEVYEYLGFSQVQLYLLFHRKQEHLFTFKMLTLFYAASAMFLRKVTYY
jgi:hypothetical protein